MSNIKDKILDVLDAEDRQVLDVYGKDRGMFGLMAESFRNEFGRLRRLSSGFI